MNFATRSLVFLCLLATQPVPAATFVVNSLSDDNAGDSNPGDGICEDLRGGTRCTLRAAIQEANFGATFDMIHFNVGSFFVINLESPLPTITSTAHIDGRTEVGYNSAATDIAQAPPRVYLNGAGLDAFPAADGLRFLNVYGRVDALGFINFPDSGIEARADNVDINNCWIGLAANGAIAGNGRGIFLDQVDSAKIGKFFVGNVLQGLGNVISANAGDGIYVLIGENNLIAGNRIGTSPDGGLDRGNGGDGIELLGPDNHVGTASNSVPVPNRIAYNNGHGVNAGVGGQHIQANEIMANSNAGVFLAGGSSDIGFNPGTQGNYIHGNGGAGVQLTGSAHRVRSNSIYQNAGRGVDAASGSAHEISQNNIYGNGSDGVRLASSASEVRANEIGRINGVLAANLGNGVLLEAGGNLMIGNRIGGAPGSQGDGVEVRSGSANEIKTNHIGVYQDANFGNAGFGIRVGATATNTLIEGNHVGFNGGGIVLLGSGTRVCANNIGGVSTTGLAAGNFGEGIYVESTGNIVGSVALDCSGNIIGHNASAGVILRGSGHVVADNRIGWFDAGNGSGGIKVDIGAEGNLLARNELLHNDGDGVRLVAGAGTRNRIEENTFFGNSGIGIDLGDDGITANDNSDSDSGPNNVQNHPLWIGAVSSPAPGQIRVEYWVNTFLVHASYPITVHFYRAGFGTRQGSEPLHIDQYATQAVSRLTTITLPPGVTSGNLIAIAIDDDGNTSEFGELLPFTVTPMVDNVFKNGFEGP